jgi:hypothetical protein
MIFTGWDLNASFQIDSESFQALKLLQPAKHGRLEQ